MIIMTGPNDPHSRHDREARLPIGMRITPNLYSIKELALFKVDPKKPNDMARQALIRQILSHA